MNALHSFFFVFSMAVVSYYVVLHLYYFFLLLVSARGIWLQPRWDELLLPKLLRDSPVTPPVTILVPAHNEEPTIVESVRALLGLHYPKLRVIVINDGSADDTLTALIHAFSLRKADLVYDPRIRTEPVRGLYLSQVEPRFLLIDKQKGGKSDALNAGLNLCRTPWVCAVDADSILEEDSLLRLVRSTIEDSTVTACSGIVRIVNGCRVAGGRVLRVSLPRQALVVHQVVEYLQAFLQGRLGWDRLNALLIISGAFGIFHTQSVRDVGGYRTDTVGEDMEVVVRLHKHLRARRRPYRIIFMPDPVCWTEVPASANMLRKQRRRWHKGLAEAIVMNRDMLFARSGGTVGWLAMPFFCMELLSPLFEVVGFVIVPTAWLLGWVSMPVFLLYLALALLMGIVYAVSGVLMEEFSYRRYNSWRDLLRLLGFALVHHLGYHQMVVWFRLEGMFDYLFGRKGWGVQDRAGFQSAGRSTQEG